MIVAWPLALITVIAVLSVAWEASSFQHVRVKTVTVYRACTHGASSIRGRRVHGQIITTKRTTTGCVPRR